MNLSLPPQTYPVLQTDFTVPPDCGEDNYRGTGRLQGLRALITGGDSGIGRAVVIAYLREGARVAINYLPDEEADAQDLADFVAQEDFSIERIPGDLTNETFCGYLIEEAASRLGGLDILIGNAA
jgi:NAD(P)-dependent dehydrogenase (short-subunit alcohol dehydrogenase family)